MSGITSLTNALQIMIPVAPVATNTKPHYVITPQQDTAHHAERMVTPPGTEAVPPSPTNMTIKIHTHQKTECPTFHR
jgi:hypothetical protein